MATKKKIAQDFSGELPQSLEGHPFYGIPLDNDQREFAEAIISPEYMMVCCNSVAGSGKTTVSIAAACLLYHHGIYDEILYVRVPTSETEGRIGYLPGSITDKTRFYMSPLYNTLANIGENPITAINDETLINQKNGSGFISAITDIYMRGEDYKNKVVIIDEAQNATRGQLQTIISRCADSCKVICIGSSRQVDLADPEASGFLSCIEHFSSREWVKVCDLKKNYRGEMSAWADLM